MNFYFEFLLGINWLQPVLWQYEKSEKLLEILKAEEKFCRENIVDFWFAWYVQVFSVYSADAFGLSVWARIFGIPFTLRIDEAEGGDKWAFGVERENFGNGNFGRSPDSTAVSLETLRILVILRTIQISERPTVVKINERIKYMCDSLDIPIFYAIDNLDMTMRYVFTSPISRELLDAINQFNVMPKPAAVGFTISEQSTAYFGFNEDDENFYDGTFGS